MMEPSQAWGEGNGAVLERLDWRNFVTRRENCQRGKIVNEGKGAEVVLAARFEPEQMVVLIPSLPATTGAGFVKGQFFFVFSTRIFKCLPRCASVISEVFQFFIKALFTYN
jgi:hypothetical protein